MILGIYQYLSV